MTSGNWNMIIKAMDKKSWYLKHSTKGPVRLQDLYSADWSRRWLWPLLGSYAAHFQISSKKGVSLVYVDACTWVPS